MVQRKVQILEVKGCSRDRADLMLRHRGQHRLKPGAVADGDPLQTHLPRDDGAKRRLDRQAGQDANHGDCAAGPHRAQRERQRLRAPQLYDQVIPPRSAVMSRLARGQSGVLL